MNWEDYRKWMESELGERGYKLSDPARLSAAILELSNLYQASRVTSWEKPSTQAAYLAYFMPLNYLRARFVFDIYRDLAAPLLEKLKDRATILDFGSGPGTTEWMLQSRLNHRFELDCLEISETAIRIHQSLHRALGKDDQVSVRWNPQGTSKYALGIFQTSLNEVGSLPAQALQCEQLLFIEPSTHQKARPLMALRETLIENGYSIWAPCTHHHACPLLRESKRDWCHDRRPIDHPPWFASLKNHLPIENRDVTFSYLILSRRPATIRDQQARIIGDPLVEKGKTRQMVCRGPHREFLSWLHRKGQFEAPERGDLVFTEGWPEAPRTEIRLDAEANVAWTREPADYF